jgi:hypothetical protein
VLGSRSVAGLLRTGCAPTDGIDLIVGVTKRTVILSPDGVTGFVVLPRESLTFATSAGAPQSNADPHNGPTRWSRRCTTQEKKC